MKSDARGYIPSESWDNGITALLLNYSYNGSSNSGRDGNSQSDFLNLNSGVNIGPRRLRDRLTWSATRSGKYKKSQWQHIESYAERAIVPLRSRLVIGNTTTFGDIFDSLRISGVQVSTDDDMYPDSQRGFAPVIRGTAATNAVVEVRQNGYVIYQMNVSPGAFAIDELYPVYSSGDLDVTVTESDGSKQQFFVPYSAVPILLREGRAQYALVAGRYQASRYSDSQSGVVQGTLKWGLPGGVTLYGGTQFTRDYFAGLAGGGLNLGFIGAVSADITQANSTLADGSKHQGQSLRALYSRSLNSLGTHFQLTGYRYSTRGFYSLEEAALDMSGSAPWGQQSNEYYYAAYNNKRDKFQANITQRIGNAGSMYFNGVYETYWNIPGASNSLQVGFNYSTGRVNYNLNYSYSRFSQRSAANQTVFLSVSLPLSSRMYASYNTNNSGDHQVGISGNTLENNKLNWNVTQGYSRNKVNSGNLSLGYQGGYGSANSGYSYGKDYRQFNYGLSGGGILHSEGVTLGQSLGETTILVEAPGVSGVSLENGNGVKTGAQGYAIQPYATPYRENRVALNANELPVDIELEQTVHLVVPSRGAVVKTSFQGHRGSRVLMSLIYQGKPVPFGAMATINERSGIVADEGIVFLSGLKSSGVVRAAWGKGSGKQCLADYHLPESGQNGEQESGVVRVSLICR